MIEQEIRDKYQRDGGPAGKNDKAITKFIEMLRKHAKSNNSYIQDIVNNINNLEILAPNFIIFESEDQTFFMHQFKALQIALNSDDLKISHEFGHCILSAINKLEVPDNFESIVKGAKHNCINEENKDKFIEYFDYLSNSDNMQRTDAEKGPVSDIISSVFQQPSLVFAKLNKQCVLPSFHIRSYYFDEEKGQMRTKVIFDEQFANFYALVANNCDKELQILKELLGEEWYKTMENELEKASRNIRLIKDKQNSDPIENIKGSITDTRAGQVPNLSNEINRDNYKLNNKEERRTIT